jgi:hypothetical protein
VSIPIICVLILTLSVGINRFVPAYGILLLAIRAISLLLIMMVLSDVLFLALHGIQLLLLPLSLILQHLLPQVVFDVVVMISILHLLRSLAAVLLARVGPVLEDWLTQLVKMRPLRLLLVVVMVDGDQIWGFLRVMQLGLEEGCCTLGCVAGAIVRVRGEL